MLHLLGTLVIGLIAGEIADRVMGRKHGMIVAMIIGLIGGGIGWFLVNHTHVLQMAHIVVPAHGVMSWAIALGVAVIGAIILIFVLGLFRGGRK